MAGVREVALVLVGIQPVFGRAEVAVLEER